MTGVWGTLVVVCGRLLDAVEVVGGRAAGGSWWIGGSARMARVILPIELRLSIYRSRGDQ